MFDRREGKRTIKEKKIKNIRCHVRWYRKRKRKVSTHNYPYSIIHELNWRE